MTLLYKKGLSQELKNWRPISLLNFNYRLMAEVLAEHLKSVIVTVIHEDQSSPVPGRQIHKALLQLQDTLQYQYEWGLSTAVLNLDLEKAYD